MQLVFIIGTASIKIAEVIIGNIGNIGNIGKARGNGSTTGFGPFVVVRIHATELSLARMGWIY